MPRIPQGEFDTVASARVGSATIRPQGNEITEVVKQVSNLTGVMAQLQDQSERTDAYTYANEVKRKHQQRKVVYAAALESSNGSGMADFLDPTDTNPDMSKRRRIQRPIGEMYKEMVDGYEEDKQGARNLVRQDIAGELMSDYVGDDLIQTQIQTNKYLNKVRTKETTERVQENMEINLSNFVQQAIQPDANPNMVSLFAGKLTNSMNREFGTVSNIIGREGVENFQKLSDRAYGTAANQILSTGVTGSTVFAADELVKRIRDPGQRQAAMIKLENTKKTTSTVTALTRLNSNKDLIAQVSTAPALDDVTYVRGMESVRTTLNMFTDPKYTPIGDTEKQTSAVDLASSLLSKRLMQQNIGVDMTYLQTNPADRSPSAAAASSNLDQLRANIDEELKASGISGMMGGNTDLVSSVREMTIQRMRIQQASIGDNIPDIVKANKPGLTGRAFIEEVQHAANAQGAGDVALVGKKERAAFKQSFTSELAKSPADALNLFNQQIANAGAAYEGETSYRRAMAIDLVDKNPDMAFLIPAADADQQTQYQMMQNASRYKSLLKEIPEISDGTFQEAFTRTELRSGLQALRSSNPTMYEGVKQAIFHDAANYVTGKGDVQSAVEKAADKMKSMYTSIPAVDGSSSILAMNRAGGINYASKTKELAAGATRAIQLPMLTRDQKIDLLERYGKGQILDRNAAKDRVTTPDSAIDFHLRNLVTVQPDGRYPNMHKFQIGGADLQVKGKIIKVSAEEILQYGAQEKEARKARRGVSMDDRNDTLRRGR